MWIRNQDKNSIINVISFIAEKGPSKNHKGLIYGYFSGGSSLAHLLISYQLGDLVV